MNDIYLGNSQNMPQYNRKIVTDLAGSQGFSQSLLLYAEFAQIGIGVLLPYLQAEVDPQAAHD